MPITAQPTRPALVTHAHLGADKPDQYLVLAPHGASWTTDPAAATSFESMREAMRAAARLPSALRAYGLPMASDLIASAGLH